MDIKRKKEIMVNLVDDFELKKQKEISDSKSDFNILDSDKLKNNNLLDRLHSYMPHTPSHKTWIYSRCAISSKIKKRLNEKSINYERLNN